MANELRSEQMDAARRRLAEMQKRMDPYLPKPKVEPAIQRGERYSERGLPLPPAERRPQPRHRS